MTRFSITFLTVFVLCGVLSAGAQEMMWENITALHFAATGGTSQESPQADYELSFDKCHPTADRVFRADKKGDESLFRNILPRGFADEIIGSSAHIEAGCTIMPFLGEIYYSVAEDGKDPVGYKRDLVFVSERFIDVFGIKMIEGDSHALEGPNSVIIPRSLAENLFVIADGYTNPVRCREDLVRD